MIHKFFQIKGGNEDTHLDANQENEKMSMSFCHPNLRMCPCHRNNVQKMSGTFQTKMSRKLILSYF